MQPCSVHGIARTLDRPTSTVLKILRNILRCYLYNIVHVQELLPSDLAARETFALEFLARMEVDNDWPWKILWTDEAHFHLTGYVNTQNCQIWAAENPLATHPVPLHPKKVTVGCGFTASFIIGHIFSSRRVLPVLLQLPSLVSATCLFCVTMSFQLCNSVDV